MMRVDLIGHFKPCMTEIYLHIDARMADYIRTHPYIFDARATEDMGLRVTRVCMYDAWLAVGIGGQPLVHPRRGGRGRLWYGCVYN